VAVSRVFIGGKSIGITGLEEAFEQVRTQGLTDADALKDLIMEKITAANYIPSSVRQAYREDLYEEYLVFTGELSARRTGANAVEVRLYGSSCYNCEKLDAMVKETLSRAEKPVDYEYVTDMREIARAGVMSTPALAVAGTVIIKAQVPEEHRLRTMLLEAIDKAASGG
jgi:hypothetical protein